jgi:hypothetical protein
LVLAAMVWAAGCLAIWWALPAMPRSWQPPADQQPLGFLSDGRTLVTRTWQSSGAGMDGPVQLWDIDTGRLRASHFGPDDTFDCIGVDHSHDRLEVQQGKDGPYSDTFELRLLDALSAREIAHFTRYIPVTNPGIIRCWWRTSPDGEVLAFETFENGRFQIEWHDVASGRLLRTFPGARWPMHFSPDGRRFLATFAGAKPEDPKPFTVWEVPSGREIASFPAPAQQSNLHYPKEFSPDGMLLLAGRTNVWEVATGKLRFQAADIDSSFSAFSADSRWLIVEHRTKAESWLSWYDVATGEEQLGRRVTLQKIQRGGMSLVRATADGRFLISTGSYMPPSPGPVRRQLARLPGLRSLGKDPTTKDRWFLIDEKTGREVAQGDEIRCECNLQGTLLLTEDRQHRHLLWDVPPCKSLSRFVALAGVLGLFVVLLSWWRREPRKPGAQKEPAPALLSG